MNCFPFELREKIPNNACTLLSSFGQAPPQVAEII
ncbi:hypothetical protein CCACVL1_22703 [Corchorus capsularis]|uniref:Uncharacterized protein n=1 Tax=Corchorus capsularis TaxID=210143 RepID=A0A1R3GX40_COCAP|nr:hypothetical protein CCACVL1_22703 [Corchorus capsularis]